MFRPFLDRRAHEELQSLALGLYDSLARRDADALWLVLSATTGRMEGDHGVWAHLEESTLHIEANAQAILANL